MRDYSPEALNFPEAYSRVVGTPPPQELMETLPGLREQKVLLPARDVAGKTAALLQGTSKLATESLVEVRAALQFVARAAPS